MNPVTTIQDVATAIGGGRDTMYFLRECIEDGQLAMADPILFKARRTYYPEDRWTEIKEPVTLFDGWDTLHVPAGALVRGHLGFTQVIC